MKKLNIVFAGTPEFTLPCLNALLKSNHHLQAVYTQPDRPAGRGRKLQGSAVKEWALNHNIPVYQPLNFKTPEAVEALAALKPDIIVVIAYGLILPRTVLAIPPLGCINVHASLLPYWRGASPIQHAILYGDQKTGVTIMQMDSGMDTGDILTQATCDIGKQETAGQLHDRLAALGEQPLLETLDKLATGMAHAIPQDNSLATYAPKILKEHAAIDWHKTANQIDCQIRAFNPWPIAYTYVGENVLRIHEADVVEQSFSSVPGTIMHLDKQGMLIATQKQALLIKRIQFSGGRVIHLSDYVNSSKQQLTTGLILGLS